MCNCRSKALTPALSPQELLRWTGVCQGWGRLFHADSHPRCAARCLRSTWRCGGCESPPTGASGPGWSECCWPVCLCRNLCWIWEEDKFIPSHWFAALWEVVFYIVCLLFTERRLMMSRNLLILFNKTEGWKEDGAGLPIWDSKLCAWNEAVTQMSSHPLFN